MKNPSSAVLILALGLALPCLAAADPATNQFFNVRAFGATGDGRTLDTPAINGAIESCAAAGGGTVELPAGTYLCGSIRLKSNIHLLIDAGATILGRRKIWGPTIWKSRGRDGPIRTAVTRFSTTA